MLASPAMLRLGTVVWICVVVAAGCDRTKPAAPAAGSAATPGLAAPARADAAVAPDAAAAQPADRAYVTDATGLVEVSPTGARVIAAAGEWCNVDARAQVVWFVSASGLQAYDLVDHTVHTVIAHDLDAHDRDHTIIGSLEPIIDWGGKEKLGGEDAVAFDVGVAVHLDGTPRVEMVMGCDGDRAVYCFDEQHRPSKSVVALKKLVKQLPLDTAYVTTLATRGKARSLWTPPPVPPKPPAPPALDASKCSDMPERCGQLTAIPGSPLWLVVTGNSRGDYYHESRELYDPAAQAFVRIDGGKLVRAKTPVGEDAPEFDVLRSSPGGVMSMHGVVFDTTRVLYAPKDTGRTCGFSSGGWRVGGPRDD